MNPRPPISHTGADSRATSSEQKARAVHVSLFSSPSGHPCAGMERLSQNAVPRHGRQTDWRHGITHIASIVLPRSELRDTPRARTLVRAHSTPPSQGCATAGEEGRTAARKDNSTHPDRDPSSATHTQHGRSPLLDVDDKMVDCADEDG